MNRFTRKIKGKYQCPIQVIILSAGVGTRTRSYEPRCLLKYKGQAIVDNQLDVIYNKFNKCEISIVGGFDIYKIIKKVGKNARIIENQLFDTTNSAESLRLGVNNSKLDNILFLHGDLVISPEIFDTVDLDQSFLLIDKSNKFEEKEVGVTIVDNKASVLSYTLPVKWCQIAYFTGNEANILRKLLVKPDYNTKYLLTFELINKIIELGGIFKCVDIKNGFIKEIDSLKDINNETSS
jgi:choline kinase